MKPDVAAEGETSPSNSAIRALEYVRTEFREVADSYTSGVEGNIARVRALILEQGDRPSAAVLRDLREITGLLRRLDLKPAKGRRKDLKKVELLVRDLLELAEGW
jgi:hypothetical protein